LIIGGSGRTPSFTYGLCWSIAEAIRRYQATPMVWDLRANPLPIADSTYHHAADRHPEAPVRALADLAAKAAGFVLATPVYHGSMSGALKNALDLLEIPNFEQKPVALASHGAQGATSAVDHLRIVVRALHGIATTTQVCTSRVDYGVDAVESDPVLIATEVIYRVDRLAAELVSIARLAPYLGRALA